MRRAFCSVALCLFASLALAQGTYTQIDVPGATGGTIVFGIDSAGDLSGLYLCDVCSYYQGFLLSNGIYTTIDYPGALSTYVQGMNDNGQIVGYTVPDGFLYDVQSQTFTKINYPGAGDTYPISINNAGAIVGYFGDRPGQYNGFELVGTTFSKIVPPGHSVASVYGISASGELAGDTYFNRGAGAIFLFNQGTYQRIVIPNAPSAVVDGINPQGSALVGYYAPSSTSRAGLLYQNKTLTTLQFPGSTYSTATGINKAGEVVGWFDDAIGYHGFTWTP